MPLFAAALFAGCQSGVERDVVQREMRQQEDQIYALEDYLSEYQQLLCEARNENAQLKRQMVKGQFQGGRPAESGAADSNTLPSPPEVAPVTPPGTTPEPEPSEPMPAVPPLDLSDPSVPPLNDQSLHEPDEIAREVQPAAAEVEVVDDPPVAVVLRGGVYLDDPASGPRVLVGVEPVDETGARAEFHGSLSLMVLDPAGREKKQQLARWDFDSHDLDAMAQRDDESTFAFPLQLPATAPTDRPVELWVRLLPEDGDKLLARTVLDLSRVGKFASVELKSAGTKPAKTKSVAIGVASTSPSSATPPRRSVPINDSNVRQSGWQTARPGETARPQAARAAAAEWKMATQPIPQAESTPVASDRYQVAALPDWSPERAAGDNAKMPPASPQWTPTR